ncbi:hypothetical protein TNCV_4600531 [Trichonephila clavipes]|nr:hypothetical protein TNCV_4600531 [Trichonephila clavipes]
MRVFQRGTLTALRRRDEVLDPDGVVDYGPEQPASLPSRRSFTFPFTEICGVAQNCLPIAAKMGSNLPKAHESLQPCI